MEPGFPWMNLEFDVDSSDFQGNPEVSHRRASRHGIPARGTENIAFMNLRSPARALMQLFKGSGKAHM